MGGTPAAHYVGCLAGDPSKLPPALLAELQALVDDWQKNNTWLPDDAPCIWLDQATGKCKHYEHRPDVCRDFEVGGAGCIRRRVEAGLGHRYRMVRGRLVRVQ